MSNNQDLRLSICEGDITHTNLIPWTHENLTSLVDAVSIPKIGIKGSAGYFIRCEGTERNNANTSHTASVLILDGDSRFTNDGSISQYAPPLESLHRALKNLDINHVIYTSASNDVDKPKYRVIIPCTYTREQLPALLDWVFVELHRQNALLVNVKENRSWSQPWFLPTVETESKPFQRLWYTTGKTLDVEPIYQQALEKSPTLAKHEPRELPKPTLGDSINSITVFNQNYTVQDVLTRNRYQIVGTRYLHPNSNSGIPSVQICSETTDGMERVYSHSGNDPLNDGFAHDAFDCFKILECGNNESQALNWNSGITKANQIEHMKNKEVATMQPITSDSPAIDTHNEILDGDKHHCTVDLLKHLEDSHPLKTLSIHASLAMSLPVNSVFLMGLAVFSSMACRKYVVKYQYADDIPIGIYAVAEQPSGVGKSRCLTLFQKPFFKAHKVKCDLYNLERKRLEAADKNQLSESDKARLAELKANPMPQLFTTNTTPEALEQSLDGTNGHFSAVSSEQGLFNSLLGLSYADSSKSNNNDLILNGFDGGYMNSMRVTREGYSGYVAGGVALFAQQGSIEKLLNVSNGTGLSERFLMLAEPHQLGKRDHTAKINIPQEVIDDYAAVAESLCRAILNKEDVCTLSISDEGHNQIALYQNRIEPHLADGGKYSHISLRGAAGKINMHIMKIAANLHLLAKNDDALIDKETTLEELQAAISQRNVFKPDIDNKHVIAAIGIAHELLEANLNLCQDKGVLGVKAAYTAILKMFEGNVKLISERQIIMSRKNVVPFKDISGNKSDAIKSTLLEMTTQRLLTKLVDATGKILSYSMAQ